MSQRTHRGAFTIVELLVVISIIGLLVGLLLPAISNARSQAKQAQSQTNLRQLGAAHASYASEWGDRQFTATVDNLSSYGSNATEAVGAYIAEHRVMNLDGSVRDNGMPPPIELGWGLRPGDTTAILRVLPIGPAFPRHYSLVTPIAFTGASGGPPGADDIDKMGYFRLPNARQFSQYLSGRFYDPVFYAPKDTVVNDMREEAADLPNEFTPLDVMQSDYGWSDDDFCYSSYTTSPAALYSPEVLSHEGWRDPWELDGSLRAPALSQALYPSLKTHMLEHHWLQNARAGCNEGMPEGNLRPYHGCQPYFFNHSRESAPAALFYDSHVELIGVSEAERADGRMQAQSGWGLWSRDTPFGADGYFIEYGYDQAATSFHILTTDGIRGRDILSD